MVQIKKYSNRRFYDATHSEHISLAGIHELVCSGEDVQVTDSKSGADITNSVLAQIILEQETAKLEVIPTNILHTVIRTKRNMLTDAVDGFFREWLTASRDAQSRWLELMQKSMTGFNPFNWPMPGMPAASRSAGTPAATNDDEPAKTASSRADSSTAASRNAGDARKANPNKTEPAPSDSDEVASLRAELARLANRLDELDG